MSETHHYPMPPISGSPPVIQEPTRVRCAGGRKDLLKSINVSEYYESVAVRWNTDNPGNKLEFFADALSGPRRNFIHKRQIGEVLQASIPQMYKKLTFSKAMQQDHAGMKAAMEKVLELEDLRIYKERSHCAWLVRKLIEQRMETVSRSSRKKKNEDASGHSVPLQGRSNPQRHHGNRANRLRADNNSSQTPALQLANAIARSGAARSSAPALSHFHSAGDASPQEDLQVTDGGDNTEGVFDEAEMVYMERPVEGQQQIYAAIACQSTDPMVCAGASTLYEPVADPDEENQTTTGFRVDSSEARIRALQEELALLQRGTTPNATVHGPAQSVPISNKRQKMTGELTHGAAGRKGIGRNIPSYSRGALSAGPDSGRVPLAHSRRLVQLQD